MKRLSEHPWATLSDKHRYISQLILMEHKKEYILECNKIINMKDNEKGLFYDEICGHCKSTLDSIKNNMNSINR
jgi:hypothetical protein